MNNWLGRNRFYCVENPDLPQDIADLYGPNDWADIEDYPGYYVSYYGDVYNAHTNRFIGGVNGTRHLGWKEYPLAALRNHNGIKNRPVHILVAKAFVPGETEERWLVNHIDRNKHNARADNLEWATRKENDEHWCALEKQRIQNSIPIINAQYERVLSEIEDSAPYHPNRPW